MNRSATQAIAPALQSVRQFDLNYGAELQRTIRLMQPAITASRCSSDSSAAPV